MWKTAEEVKSILYKAEAKEWFAESLMGTFSW